MVLFCAIAYLVFIVLQPAEWLKAFEGVPIQELILLAGLSAAFFSKNNRLFELLRYPPVVFFILYIFIAIIGARYMGMSYALGDVGYYYLKLLFGILLLVLAWDSVDKIEKSYKWMVLSGALVGLLLIRLAFTGQGVGAGIGTEAQSLNWRGAVQWIGSFAGTNTTAMLLILLLGFNFGLLFSSKQFFGKLLWGCTLAVLLYAFYLTDSRGGFIGLLALMAAYFYRRRNISLKVFIPLALFFAITAIALKPEEEGRSLGKSSSPERIELFHQALQRFKENPVLGIGTGQFAKNNPVRKRAHNIYMQVLAETGFVGAIFFVMSYFVAVRNVLVYLKQYTKQDYEYQVMSTGLITFVGMCATLFFLSPLSEIPYILLALLIAPGFHKGCYEPVTAKVFAGVVLVNMVFISLVYVTVQLFFVVFK